MGQRAIHVLPLGPIVEESETLIVGSYYKLFMDVNFLRFNGREGKDKAVSWFIEIEKTFYVIELSEQIKVKCSTYILVDDAESWWCI